MAKYTVTSGFIHENGVAVHPAEVDGSGKVIREADVVEIESEALAKHYMAIQRIVPFKGKDPKKDESKSAAA